MSEDKTSVVDIDKTIVISPEKLAAARNSGSARVSEKSGSNRPTISIFSDLGDFLFPRKKTVVDDTLTLVAETGKNSDQCELPTANPDLVNVGDHYQLAAEPFAAGGQGSVSRAVDRALGCEIAVKSLHRELCEDELSRSAFVTEAKLTAALDHPAIIPIHGLFGDGKQGMHLAMKLIEGHSLSSYLHGIVTAYEQKGIRNFDESQSLRNRLDMFLRVCEAIGYAHDRGIIHCDLKPGNIMIGKHHETYVTDWGLAMKLKCGTELKRVKGTPAFIAPEVITTKKPDVRSDIYSLGIILFELVTLSPAFPDDEVALVLERVKAGLHSPIRHRFKYRVDEDLVAIIKKAIDVDPDRRYQTVGALAEDLRRYLAGEETTANPDHIFGRISRWAGNHRRGLLISTMALMLVAAGCMVYTLHRQIRLGTERRLRDRARGMAYSTMMKSANELEHSLERIEYQVGQLRTALLLAQLGAVPEFSAKGVAFVPMDDYRKNPPPSFIYAPSYRHKIDPDGATVLALPGKLPEAKKLAALTPVGAFMREALFGVGDNRGTVEELLQQGRPIKKIYFALTDGTIVCYPGSCDDFPAGYNPLKRIWYQQAVKNPGRTVWSGPYQDSGTYRELVLTCSATIPDGTGKLAGVAAIDFSLTKLAEKILNEGNEYDAFILGKMLISPAGEVIFQAVPPERKNAVPSLSTEQISRLVKQKYGTSRVSSFGRETLFAFAYLDSINTFYVEALDMTALLSHLKVADSQR